MSTELLEIQQTSAPSVEGITLPKTERGPRWWLVLAVAIAVAVTVGGGGLVLMLDEAPETTPGLSATIDGFDPADYAGFVGTGHAIPRDGFDPADYAGFVGTGHVPPA